MNYSLIRYILSGIISVLGVFLLGTSVVGLIYSEKEGIVYLLTGIICLALGVIGSVKKVKDKTMFVKGGLAAVSLGWVTICLIGALPFFITKEIPSYTDALFETVSGFTTTGSTILTDVERLSFTSLFWRSFTHWVGGMGFLMFIMVVLPVAGNSGLYLMKAESPGPVVGKLVPKIKGTAAILYSIYSAITVIEIIALKIAGLSMFESVTLSFGTVGTGGFAPLNSSIAMYSPAVQIIITIFMIICATNFNVYYLIITKRAKQAFRSEELRVFLGIVVVSIVLIAINIRHITGTVGGALRHSAFQVASVISTTGYMTADYDLWPSFSKSILFALMFLGACAGSTGGGFKVSRMIIILKSVKNNIISAFHPRNVSRVQVDGERVSEETRNNVLNYLGLYVFIYIISVLIISIDGHDITTNMTAIAATFNNIGPGLGAVGPVCNFTIFGTVSKYVMMFDMIAGRLELIPVMVIFFPHVWKKRIRK